MWKAERETSPKNCKMALQQRLLTEGRGFVERYLLKLMLNFYMTFNGNVSNDIPLGGFGCLSVTYSEKFLAA